MIDSGLEAHLSTVDLKKLPGSLAGRRFDDDLLATLPAGVDPWGETANSIPSCRPVPCSRAMSLLRSARRSSAMDSLMLICCRLGYERSYALSTPPVRFLTSATILSESASISASVIVFSRG